MLQGALLLCLPVFMLGRPVCSGFVLSKDVDCATSALHACVMSM